MFPNSTHQPKSDGVEATLTFVATKIATKSQWAAGNDTYHRRGQTTMTATVTMWRTFTEDDLSQVSRAIMVTVSEEQQDNDLWFFVTWLPPRWTGSGTQSFLTAYED